MSYTRFIVAGDSHGDLDSLKKLVDYADYRNADIIFDGDISGYPTKEDGLMNNKVTFEKSIDIFSSYKDRYTYIIPGSHEIRSVWYKTKFPENVIDVDKRLVKVDPRRVDDFSIIGYGGSKRAPGYIKPGEGFRRIPRIDEINDLFFENDDHKIFLTHEPPYGYGDVGYFIKHDDGGIQAVPPDHPNAQSSHDGSKVFEIVVETLRPKLTVSGHFHGNPIAQKIGTKEKISPGTSSDKGIFINPGELTANSFQSEGGHFAEVEIYDSGYVKYLGHRNIKE